jgi:flagellar hook-length control protein FliK
MNPIRIAPSPSTSTSQTDAAASGSSESGADFGPILLAASGKAERPLAPRDPQRQGGSADPAQAARDRVVASRGRASSQTDSKGGNDTAAAAAAACTAAQGAQVHSDTAPASGQTAGTACAAADATRVTATAVDAASASGAAGSAAAAAAAGATTIASASAGPPAAGAAGAAAVASAPAGQPAASAAVTPGAIAAPIGAPTMAQAVAVSSADAQPPQPAGSPPAFERAMANQGASLAATDASADAETGAGAGGDPSSAFSAALPSVLAGGRDGVAAIAQAAAATLISPASKPIDAAFAHADSAAATIASDAPGAPAAGPITPAPIYSPDGRSSVATPVNHPDFGQELSQRVVLLARGGVQTAQISLQPADLGPVGVSIQVHGHAATLAFTAAHEATRTALEASLPRLREAFAASGLQLSDATVGGRSHSDWTASARPQSPARADDGGAVAGSAPAAEPAPVASAAAVRLVDIYA